MTDTSVTSITATYQQRIAAKQYVAATTYGRPTLDDQSLALHSTNLTLP